MGSYLKIVKVLAILALFTPLIISKGTLFPFIFGKSIAFQAITEAMLAFYLLGLVKFPEFRPKLSALGIALGAFFLVLVLSTIFSVDPYVSFWSKHERMEGLFNLLHYLVFFLILSGVFRTREDWLGLLKWSVAACLLVCFYALGQIAKLPGFIQAGVSGTLGNASFLATYLIFNAFFALFLFFERSRLVFAAVPSAPRADKEKKSPRHGAERPASRWFYLACFVFFDIILLATGCRGAIFGQLAGLSLLFGFYGFFTGSPRVKKCVIGSFILVIIIASLLFAFRDAAFVKGNQALNRIANISLESATMQQRFAGWRTGWEGFKARPVFGWGSENYYVAFYKYMDPYFYGPAETFDRAHNKYIDLLVMNGLFGFLAYAGIFAVLFFWIFRTLIKNRRDIAAIWFLGLFAAYLIQNFVLFDMPAAYLMFFPALGFANFVFFPPVPAAESSKIPNAVRSGPKVSAVLNFFLVPAIIFVMWWGNFRPFMQSQKIIDAMGAMPDYAKSLSYSREVLGSPSFAKVEGRQLLARTLIEAGSQEPDAAKDSQSLRDLALYLVEEFQKGIKESPLNFRYYLSLASVYNFLGAADPAYYQKSEETARQASAVFPRNIEILFKIFSGRAMQGDWPAAEAVLGEVLAKAPDSHLGHWYLAICYYNEKRYEGAQAEAEKAISLGYPSSPNTLVFLASIQADRGDFPKAIGYLEEVAKLTPRNPDLLVLIAQTYHRMGDDAKAREWAQKILDLSPVFKDKVDELLKTFEPSGGGDDQKE